MRIAFIPTSHANAATIPATTAVPILAIITTFDGFRCVAGVATDIRTGTSAVGASTPRISGSAKSKSENEIADRLFPTNEIAEQWFTEQRWPNGICCPACGSVNVQTRCRHKTMPYRCREKECKKKFSVKTGTVMECAKVSYQDSLLAAFLLMTSLKSVSSMKLHRDLGVSQKTAWFLAQRLRAALSQDGTLFAGPVEVDETYVGGRRRNMSNTRRRALAGTGHGSVGKTAVVGVKDRATKHVAATVVKATDAATLHGFVRKHTAPGATVYTDDATAYTSLPFNHATVKHSLSEYVKGDIHTNGIESLWSMLKRAPTRARSIS